MNRCLKNRLANCLGMALIATSALPVLSIGAGLAFPSEATAQGIRLFPAAARRAILVVATAPEILLNGNPERLSPGARIRGATNTFVTPSSLSGQRVLVNYVRDPQGMVHEIWILTEAEAQEKRAGLETVFNFKFGSEENQPKRDDGKTPFNQLPKYPQQ
ncbi:MAG TPA: hypothetical protein VLJ57_02030 [Burkholderiaceae bacterium]|nr:hypothetical protein [Burkholderiaceae bacterium]